MLQLLRNFRKISLQNGNINTYLKYALGEILLIVVGILIASGIGNVNAEAEKNQQFEKGFSQLYTNLDCEIGFIEQLLIVLI